MKKMIFGVVAGLLLGGIAGSLIAQQSMRQHRQGRAVMWLLQHHLDGLTQAAQQPDCNTAQAHAQRLPVMADELAAVFPLAVAQDEVFRRHVDQLRRITAEAAQVQCTQLPPIIKILRDACDQCHRDYR